MPESFKKVQLFEDTQVRFVPSARNFQKVKLFQESARDIP